MADKAFITPAVLRWARETAKMSEGDAAAKAGVKEDRLKEWEEGSAQPTIRQAQLLAKAYRRPFALFFLPDIPRDFQPLQDFRRSGAKELSTSSIFIIRDIRQKQSWISESALENGERPAAFVGRYAATDDPRQVAMDILQTLEIVPGDYSGNALKAWIDAAEAKGIFISRCSFIHSRMKLDSEEFQGFAIADPHAPFVFINSEDWPAAQLFTLVHELAHLWIAATGLSNEIAIGPGKGDWLHPVELFCNEVAALALMPTAALDKEGGRSIYLQYDRVSQVARKFGVSSYAMLVRALRLEWISLDDYRSLKQRAEDEYAAYLQREAARKALQKAKEEPSGPNPYLLKILRNGRLFTQVVMDAYNSGAVQPTEASSLLNTPLNKFPQLLAQLYR